MNQSRANRPLPRSAFTAAAGSRLLLPGIALLLYGCGDPQEPLNPGKLTAYVTVIPQASIVAAIGGEHVVVEVLARDGQDPHAFSPSPKQTVQLGRADVWFTTRMPFEKRLSKKVSSGSKRLKIVDTTPGVPLFPESQPAIEHDEAEHAGDHAEHGHDHDHDHDHSAGDPHLWLSPPLIKIQAVAIAASLSELDPAHAASYQENLQAFAQQMDKLNAELENTLGPYRGTTFLAYHGALSWFAEAYGLRQEVIEISGRTPETKRLHEIIKNARSSGIRVVFTQPQYDRTSAEAVAEGLGGTVVDIDPMAADVAANLRHIANELVAALETQTAAPTSPGKE